ncbi:MAG: hypothetical protein IT373_37090 [Polyangiaceae bacterium]|nr:hypothetical protein [Polyangiaceae bacterium]
MRSVAPLLCASLALGSLPVACSSADDTSGTGGGGAASGTGGAGGSSACSASTPGPNGCWLPMALAGAPAERRDVGVWAGTELLVWGGMHLDPTQGTLNDGAGYAPAPDVWRPLPAAPIWGRAGHVAVWTGEEMLVWSGGNEEGDHQAGWLVGGRYRPGTEAWTEMSATGVPVGRGGATAVWTGTHMLAWGGSNEYPPGLLNDGGAYDPTGDTWSALSTVGAPTGRMLHVAVWTGTEMLVWGGFDETSNIAADASTGGRYDPAADTWAAMAVPAGFTGRREHRAVWTGTELLVWGGASGETVDADGARYAPDADAWTPMASAGAPSARQRHVAVWTGSRMLVWGGSSAAGVPFAPLADGALYDPATDAWTPMATEGAPEARAGALAAWTGDRMVVWGGVGTGEPLATGGVYFPPL